MLRSIRSRILVILALPIVVLLAIAGVVFSIQVAAQEDAERIVAALDQELAARATIGALQDERASRAGWSSDADLTEVEARTDEALAGLATDPFVISIVQIDLEEARSTGSLEQFGAIVDRLRDIGVDPATVNDAAIDRLARSARTLASIREDAYLSVLAIDAGDEQGRLLDQQRRLAQIEVFRQIARSADVARLDAALASQPAIDLAIAEADAAADRPTDAAGPAVAALDTDLSALASSIDAELLDRGDSALLDANNGRTVATLVALVGGLALAGLVYVTHVSIVRPLSQLTNEARHAASTTLPMLVSEIEVLGSDDLDPDEAMTPISRPADDEIGEVVDAFNAVHDTALRLAVEQARGRRNVSQLFVTLGRRNQRLLERQLRFISELEERETDREGMKSLFELDHLATRMRRNAESLLVIAGTESPRQWRNPVPMDAVVKAALGEVEEYGRVEVVRIDGHHVIGALVADLSHLLAEIIDNALSFSNPTSKVHVVGLGTPDGFQITVSDRGIGVEAHELAALNTQLARPPAIDEISGRRLGIFIVSNLAHRHDISVRLEEAQEGGIVARVDLPARVVVDPVAASKITLDAPSSAAVEDAEPAPIVTTPLPTAPAPEPLPSAGPSLQHTLDDFGADLPARRGDAEPSRAAPFTPIAPIPSAPAAGISTPEPAPWTPAPVTEPDRAAPWATTAPASDVPEATSTQRANLAAFQESADPEETSERSEAEARRVQDLLQIFNTPAQSADQEPQGPQPGAGTTAREADNG